MVPRYCRQIARFNNVPVVGSILEWTFLPQLGIWLFGSLESLYRPACPRRTLRQIEEKKVTFVCLSTHYLHNLWRSRFLMTYIFVPLFDLDLELTWEEQIYKMF